MLCGKYETAVALTRADKRISKSDNTNAGLIVHELKWFTKSLLFVAFCTESENVATACRMMMMSMKKKKEEVHHHPSHIVVLPARHHHQSLLQTDQGFLGTGVTGGKCYENSGISFLHSGILALFLGGHVPNSVSKEQFVQGFL
jgi:hypothetical protein